MSALPPKADIDQRLSHVRFVPEADIGCPLNPNIILGRPIAALKARIEYAARLNQQ